MYDAFQLQVRYHRPRHEVTIRVTICADGVDHISGTVAAVTSQQGAGKPLPCSRRPQRGSTQTVPTVMPVLQRPGL